MADKLDLSLDEIIAIEGITENTDLSINKSFNNNKKRKHFHSNQEMSQSWDELMSSTQRMSTNYQLNNDFIRSRNHFGTNCGKIFVNNLKYEVTDEDLKTLFEAFGALKRAAVNYQSDGRSAGTALVVFERKSDALNAFNSLNSLTLDGRPLRLRVIDDFGETSGPLDVRRLATEGGVSIGRGMQRSSSIGGKSHIWSDLAMKYNSSNGLSEEVKTYRRNRFQNYNNDSTGSHGAFDIADLDSDLDSYISKRKIQKY